VLLGVAYKPSVSDMRQSPALKILKLLAQSGADLAYHDPHVEDLTEAGLSSTPLDTALEGADLVVIVTAHPEVDYRYVVAESRLVLDFRGVTRDIQSANLVRL
jgi:UDP-N-acetyl-D-glucosamine dehydrogenase